LCHSLRVQEMRFQYFALIYEIHFITRCDEVATWSRNIHSSFCRFCIRPVSNADAEGLESTIPPTLPSILVLK
jgi:hypothetical protein